MRVEKKAQVRNGVMRGFWVALAIILQFIWLFYGYQAIARYINASVLSTIITVVLAIWIYGRETNQAYKTPWIILILGFPIMGIVIFAVLGRKNSTKRMRQVYQDLENELNEYRNQDPFILEQMEKEDLSIANQSRMIYNSSHYPVYKNTKVSYFPEAIDGLEAQIKALEAAEKFIFMEYHAIEDEESFGRIKEILIQKAKAGVEVRLFYDDVGSLVFINTDFIERMENVGIQCRVFNPVRPILLAFMNNRDHRKITVIDGKVGFTGGYNLANEYFNITHPYGYWKDTGVQLEGDAVNALTLTFLENWNAMKKTDTDFNAYLVSNEKIENDGYVHPYADDPLDQEYLGEDVYMGVLNNAKKYAYFVTPYLIITDEMIRTMQLAAKRGVDVRIITPGIPDKKFTYALTRSYYHSLVKAGIRIYEYTPGFCHCKMSISDDTVATCGTINLDYRSLYLHFENGVYFYKSAMISDMKKDFESMFSQSNEVSEYYKKDESMPLRTWKALLRMFAPLF